MNQQEARLIKNTLIFAVGSFGSRILSFIIVPLYSYYINTEAFGIYDLIITTVSMLTPIITLQISDGVYRWLIDGKNDQRKVISTALRLLFASLAAASAAFFAISRRVDVPYFWGVWVYCLFSMTYGVVQQMIRGLGYNKLYSLGGLAYTIVLLSLNVVGLIVLRLGVETLLYSAAIASAVCLIIFFRKLDIVSALAVGSDADIRRDMILYSLPLIPNVICWWVINSVDRYMIRYFIGPDANGIYSMAAKYPTIITVITGIFYLAWQESAIKEYDTPNRNEFFSAIFNQYNKLLFSTVMVCIPLIKLFIVVTMEQSYKGAWEYTGLLMLGCAFSALCSFLGIAYNISKDTKNAFYTTLIAAAVDALLNLIFMKRFGLQVASLSTFFSYVVLFAVRLEDCKKYFKLTVRWKEFAGLFMGAFAVFLLSFRLDVAGSAAATVALIVVWFILNRGIVLRYGKGAVRKVAKMIQSRRGTAS